MEKKRILVVDDEEFMRNYVKRCLKSCYDIVTASDGVEAIKEVGNNGHLDLVLSDFKMPNTNGYILYHELAKRLPYLPVVLMTGDASEPYVQELSQKGVPILAKPFTQSQLEYFIKNALDQAAH